MKKALIILANGFEETEVVAPINLLRRAGANVTIATIETSLQVKGMYGIEITAEMDFDSATKELYDLIILPGGARAIAEDSRVIEFVKKSHDAGVYIGAICAAPIVSHLAGILENKKFTAHFSMHEMIPNAIKDEPVIQDGIIITAEGPAASIAFGMKLVETLFGDSKANELSDTICYKKDKVLT